MSNAGYWASKPLVGLTAADRAATTLVLPEAKTSKPRRPKQRDCRYEPPYPGEATVVISLADPDRVVHGTGPDARCFTAYPHPIIECREFFSTERDEYAEEHRWERVP